MLLYKPHLFNRTLSTSTKTNQNWRIQIKQTQLVSQISSILLQRHNWSPLLLTLNLSSKQLITPSLFLQVLQETQTRPQISLNFFNWAKTNLGFQPDLKSHCKLTQILIGSGLSKLGRPILDSLIQTHPPTEIVDSLIQSSKGTDCHSLVLSSVLECYRNKGLYLQALEVFRKTIDNGFVFPIHSCNALLEALQVENENRLAWCFYGSMLRNEFLPDQFTWSIIARILCKDGKFGRILRYLDTGIYNSVIYNLIIEYYSKNGDFKAAFNHLNEMCNKKLDLGFSTYSSILDGACKYGDIKVTKIVMDSMVEKGYLPRLMFSEYDLIIQKLCDLGKTYAADMYFRRAYGEKIELKDASYGCMLREFSKAGKVKNAIRIYRIILENRIVVNANCYDAFANVLCEEDPSGEISELLKDVVGRGYSPRASKLSKFMTFQWKNGRWKESEELLNVSLEKGLLPNSFCCSSLVEHYCSYKQIDSAIALHNKMEKLEGTLDVTTYNVLLNGLFKERRFEDAIRVFGYMRRHNFLSSESFAIMISQLCHQKELRKAMKLHDEMLKMGLKPDKKTYKRLISGFR